MSKNLKFTCPDCGEKSVSVAAEIEKKNRDWEFNKPKKFNYLSWTEETNNKPKTLLHHFFNSPVDIIIRCLGLFILLMIVIPKSQFTEMYLIFSGIICLTLCIFLLRKKISEDRKQAQDKVQLKLKNEKVEKLIDEIYRYDLSRFNKLRYCENCNILFDQNNNVRDANRFGYFELMK